MPHLTLEYSDNIEIDAQPLFARLHDELVATGAVNMKGLKSLFAIPSTALPTATKLTSLFI